MLLTARGRLGALLVSAVGLGLSVLLWLPTAGQPARLVVHQEPVLYPPPSSLLECGSELVAHDLTGDGMKELLIGCSSTNLDAVGGVLVFAADPAGSFRHLSTIRSAQPEAADGCGHSVAVGDVDGDRRPDIAIGCFADTLDEPEMKVVVARNLGRGRFGEGEPVATGRELDPSTSCKSALQGGDVGLGDVDGDGRADLVVGCPEAGDDWGAVYVLRRNAENSGFEQPLRLRRGARRRFAGCGWRVAVADVTGDRRSDVVITCPYDQVSDSTSVGRLWRQGTLAIFRRNASNSGFAQPLLLAHPRPRTYMECGQSLAVGEVNGDRRADLLWGCPRAGSSVLFRTRRSSFDSGTLFRTVPRLAQRESCGASLALGDVGGDGLADVLVGCGSSSTANEPTGAALVFRQLADRKFSRVVRLETGSRRTHDSCGVSVAGAGLRRQILVGCPGTLRGAVATGAVRVLRLGTRS